MHYPGVPFGRPQWALESKGRQCRPGCILRPNRELDNRTSFAPETA